MKTFCGFRCFQWIQIPPKKRYMLHLLCISLALLILTAGEASEVLAPGGWTFMGYVDESPRYSRVFHGEMVCLCVSSCHPPNSVFWFAGNRKGRHLRLK